MVAISITPRVKEVYTYENERTVFDTISNEFEKGNNVELSFDGFMVIPSSFTNGCLVVLLKKYGSDRIKQNLKIIHSTKQINQVIKSRLGSENIRVNQI